MTCPSLQVIIIVNPQGTLSKYLYLLMLLKLRFLEEIIKNKVKEKPSCQLEKLKSCINTCS